MKTIWIVTVVRENESGSERSIVGVYEKYEDALELVNRIYGDEEERYIEEYGDHDGSNHNNGYAELHIDSGWDEVYIYAVECPINDTCKMDI